MNTKEKNKGLSIVLSIVLILLFICIGVAINNEPIVNAENIVSTELCQVPLTYSISNGEVTITGYDLEIMRTFSEEQKSNLEIVIPATIENSPVTKIKERAFDLLMTSIDPREYRFISLDFSGATNLKSIESAAFRQCSMVKNRFNLPDSLEVIGDNAFNFCGGTIINMPASLTHIGEQAFANCHFVNVVFPDTLTYIGDRAFNSSWITNAFLPNKTGVTYGTEIFKNVRGMVHEFILLAPTKELYEEFSKQEHNLSTHKLTYETIVTFDTQNGDKIEQTKLFGYPLNYYKSRENNWTVDYSYTLPTANRDEHKFSGWATSMDNASIDVTTVVHDAATYYAQYEILTFKSDFIQGIGYVIKGYTGAYLNSQVGQGITDIQIEIPENYDDGINGINNVVEIGKEAFYTGTSTDYKFVSLDLTKALYLTGIGESAFYECTDIKSKLLFPDSLKTIGKNAFNKCYGFTGSLIIPDSVTTIDGGAFYECSSLDGTLKLPENENFTKISEYAFQNCIGLIGELLIPNSVYEISRNAFFNCIGFSKLTLPINDNFKQIGDYAFQLCNSLTGVLNIPNSVNKMNVNAFYDCSKLETVYLPNVQGLEWESTTFGNVKCPIVADNKNLYEVYRNNDKMANLNNLTYVSDITFNPGEGALTGNSSQTKLYGYPLAYEKNVDSLIWSYNNEYALPTAMLSGYIFDGFLVSEEIGLVNRDTIVIDNPIYLASYTKIALTHIEIATQPNKVTYKAFETFNKDGIVVKAYFNDNTEKEVTDYIIEYSDGNNCFCFGDTYITIVYTEEGISARVQQSVSVEKISLSIPTIKGDYVYDGDWQTVTLENFDESTMTLNNNTRLNAGRQKVIVSLKDKVNYKWLDVSSDDITLEWIIETIKVVQPKENNALFTYTGSSQTYYLESNNAYIITNNVKVDAGSYIVEVTLKNEGDIINYEWVNGGHNSLSFDFIIDRAVAEKPVIANTYTYNGSKITANVVTTEKYRTMKRLTPVHIR